MDKVYGNIYETTDYSKFKRLKGNRDPKTSKKIIKSIESVGYVLDPILVNDNWEIIDGQNRFEAIKALGLPVIYVQQANIGRKECQALNINQSNWNTENYITSFAEDEIEDYVRLKDLVCAYKNQGFGLEGIVFFAVPSLIPMSGSGTYSRIIKEGNFKLSEDRYELTKKRLTSAISLGLVKFKNNYNMANRTFWGAISYAYEHQEIEIIRLAQKIKENPLEIVSCSHVSEQLRYFDNVYNKGVKAANRVYMSTDLQKRLYLNKEDE